MLTLLFSNYSLLPIVPNHVLLSKFMIFDIDWKKMAQLTLFVHFLGQFLTPIWSAKLEVSISFLMKIILTLSKFYITTEGLVQRPPFNTIADLKL